jgi:predicted DCC family thiol-disulfide oxidoreductase YuxK
MLFDGACNFCNGSVNFVLTRSRRDAIDFCAMQSPAGQVWLRRLGLPLEGFSTMALVADGTVFVKSAAALHIAALMDPPWPLLARLFRLVPQGLGDLLYDRIAANRFRIAGRRDACMVPDAAVRARFVTEPPPEP